MTKRIYLSFSAFLNLCVMVFMVISTYRIKLALNSGIPVYGIAALANDYPIKSVHIVFSIMINFCVLTFLIKMIAEFIEKNRITVIALILDVVVLAFFLALGWQSIVSGAILTDYPMFAATAASGVAIVFDLCSFCAERWGRFF